MQSRMIVLAVAGALVSAPVLAAPATTVVPLPDGFHPEGIANGRGNVLYVAEFDTGAVFQLDARTGHGHVLVAPQPGRAGIGLKLDQRTNYLFVAGGGTGHAYVYDARTGVSVADYALGSGSTFINDVIITRDAAYFTDSSQPTLYALPLGRHGQLPPAGAVRRIGLAGDYRELEGFNANGIEVTPQGQLIVVNSASGTLYKVDPRTGFAKAIDLGPNVTVSGGDGLLLQGQRLYVIENFPNTVAVVDLSHDFTRGHVTQTITSPDFDVIATAAKLGGALYITNARFSTTPTPTTKYWLTRLTLGN
jgi:sugar lactone lactonase YvrE